MWMAKLSRFSCVASNSLVRSVGWRSIPQFSFHSSSSVQGGRLLKIPWRMSATRKANLRKRLREVDSVIQAIEESGVQCNALRKAVELPKETEMSARDKYFVYCAKAKGYRKGIHKVPHFTKTTHRVNPKGF